MDLLFKLAPMLIGLMSDPNIAALLAQLGKLQFPNVDPNKAQQAAIAFYDSNATKWIQTALNLLGEKLTVDGVYGEGTKTAVKAFQTKYKLAVDGWAGDVTSAKLREVVMTRAPSARS
jgi:N-acetyl-anhydromuramyl-L-alanine amidase AmpD